MDFVLKHTLTKQSVCVVFRWRGSESEPVLLCLTSYVSAMCTQSCISYFHFWDLWTLWCVTLEYFIFHFILLYVCVLNQLKCSNVIPFLAEKCWVLSLYECHEVSQQHCSLQSSHSSLSSTLSLCVCMFWEQWDIKKIKDEMDNWGQRVRREMDQREKI